jgi:coatomer protein complex subunit gamma
VEILHVLGELGPTTTVPSKYIRFIYNRVILENAHIRAAAVSALAMFGAKVESLTSNVLILLRRSQQDDDDEVRDRATLAIRLLENCKNSTVARSVIADSLPMSPDQLSRSLAVYKQRPSAGALSIESLPVVEEREKTDHEKARGMSDVDEEGRPTDSPATATGTAPAVEVSGAGKEESSLSATAEELYRVPEFASLGPLFKSCAAIPLTESETEYQVRVVKHIFAHHVVLQFNLTNTLPDNLLTDVEVHVEESTDTNTWKIQSQIPAARLPYDVTKPAYVCLKRADEQAEQLQPTTFSCELRFKVKEVLPSTGVADDDDEGFEDTYPIEPVEISASDFMAKMAVADFRAAWQLIGEGSEKIEMFELTQYTTVEQAVSAVIDFLGMRPCDGTASVPPQTQKHSILLAGQYVGGIKVFAHALLTQQLKPDGSPGVIVLKIAVRSENPHVANTVLDCIR